MATNIDFANFICEQISGCGIVSNKKMFGEYMVYLNGKPIFLICNDTLFVKILPQTTDFLGENAEQGYPYGGSKIHYVIDNIDDADFMKQLAIILEKVIPIPKPKKKR